MRKIAFIATAGLLAAAAPATALTLTSATPKKAGAPSTLHFNIDGTAPPINGRLPKALQLNAPSGFRVNLKAIAQRCGQEAATLNECPGASRMGTGSLFVVVNDQGKVRTVTIPLTVYLHSNTRILAVARIFGWQVVPATLNATRGLTIRFDPLPAGPAFAGVTYALRGITLNLGATRVIKVKHGAGVTRTRLHLIRNPTSCTGSWRTSVALSFRDGTSAQIAAPTKCAKS